jgi:AbrB family looped-hinge helix DNA binding protein
MKSTGIVRRIDDLGRVVIPKDIRKKLHLKENDPVEYFLDGDSIVLKKYSFMNDRAVDLAKSTIKVLNFNGIPATIVNNFDETVSTNRKGLGREEAEETFDIIIEGDLWGRLYIGMTLNDADRNLVQNLLRVFIIYSEMWG